MELTQFVLRNTWVVCREHFIILLRLFCVIFIITLTMSILGPSLDSGMFQFMTFRLASNLFSMGLTLGAIRIVLDLLSGKEIKIEHLFDSFQLLIPYLLGYLLMITLLFILFIPFSQWILPHGNLMLIIKDVLSGDIAQIAAVSYTHLRAHET